MRQSRRRARGDHRSAVREICADAFADLLLDIWPHSGGDEARRVDLALSAFVGAPLDDGERRATTLSDRALLIFTSGTTGLPKAAAVSHHRVVAWSHWFAGLADMRADDRLYDCLPLCHSVGGVAALPAALVNGGSVVIAEKFSAGRFWSEVARWDCTIFQYIGELCRYLVAAPPSADEKRIACASPAATGFPPTYGAISPSVAAWPRSSSSTPPPKAT